MRIWVYTICKNELELMPWFIGHYRPFADRIIVFDDESTDGTRRILETAERIAKEEYNPRYPKGQFQIRYWPGYGLNDEEFLKCINEVWHEASGQADWVMFVDVDELLYSPDLFKVLREAKEDMILAEGWALIAKDEMPKVYSGNVFNRDPAHPNITHYVRTGIRQPNYDKYVCWRPHVQIEHTIGRHTYGTDWPKCKGVRGTEPKLKLLHLHHIGGVEWTKKRNQRCFDRAVCKKYAWNYTPEHDKPEQVGSVAWVRDAIENNKLVDVV